MALNLDEVIALNKFLEENGGSKIHLHDACGGQYFTLEEVNNKTVSLLNEYFEKNKIDARFSKSFDSFTIGGLKRG